MQPVENNSKTVALTDAERDLLAKTGIPPIFAKLLQDKTQDLNNAFAIRAGSPFNRYLMPASPKPASVKEKTGNWGFAKGIIPVDPVLGKILKQNDKWQLIQRDPHNLPDEPGIIYEMLHKISLQEVLSGLRAGEYELLDSPLDIQRFGRLSVRVTDKFPDESDILFSINLKEKAPRVVKQQPIDYGKLVASSFVYESKPRWWNDVWGNFEECVTSYYPAQYKHANEADFHDILIYGTKNVDETILPITGDQDLLWISMPTCQRDTLKEFEEVFNTFDPVGCEKIYKARIALYLKLGGKPEDVLENISDQSIAGLGYVTAYESYIIDDINKSFADSGITHLRNLIQHAPENHNPDHLSPLDAPMVHVWKGKIHTTENEQALIQFAIHPSYPNDNVFQINPKWNMEKWACVVEKQLELKQPIADTALRTFNKYVATKKGCSSPSFLNQRKINNAR